MYIPKAFEFHDTGKILKLIADHPFATVISTGETGLIVSHLPIIAKVNGEELTLVGHVARANPHADALDGNDVCVIFHGPHAYISPTWYEKGDVPTWNYAVVHVKGTARMFRDFNETVKCLRMLSHHMETEASGGWKFWIPDDLATPETLHSAICAFEIKASSIEAKFKLSQNRSDQDRAGVMTALERRGDSMSLGVARLMRMNE
jgi:transcriptional regulator